MGIFILVACFFNLTLGLLVLLQNPKSGSSRLFALMSTLMCVWITSNYLTDYQTSNLMINDIANKLAYISGYGVVLSGLLFTYYFPSKRIVRKFETIILITVSLLILGLSATTLVAGEVTKNSSGELLFSVGPFLWLYMFIYIALLVLIVRNLLAPSVRSDKKSRIQAYIVVTAFCVSALMGLLFNSVIPFLFNNWYATQFSPLATVVLVGMIVYAITRHRLFDIRLAAVRTLAYILSLATLSIVYYYLAYIISVVFFKGNTSSSISFSPINITLALLLAFIFQPIKRFFDKITNNIFYKDNYNTDDFFARLNKTLSVTTELRGLLERVAYEIGHTLKSEQAFFFINTNNSHFVSAGTPHHKQLPKHDAIQIGEHYDEFNGIIIASLLDSYNPTRRLMLSHRIELILPLVKDNKKIGYLCLGDHLTSGYTNRDIKALNTISDELIIAIKNALAVQEIREFNITLQQKIANATKELRANNAILRQLDKIKDEFVSMASHQLRTPLTSVKGYISMVIEGDAGKITESQRKLLDEAFMSSERMVRLINDFLNVSRIQTGKFIIEKTSVDLPKLVGEEIDSLRPNATARNLKFVYKPPKDFPILDVDEGKIRQVVMNFADNAIYYSHEDSTITIDLSIENNEIMFIVKDRGIGVPDDEKEQLFTKFFRASNARIQRPDGTGVGIYLAKKVIDAHGGKIVFDSVEGKGSTFGFRLPL